MNRSNGSKEWLNPTETNIPQNNVAPANNRNNSIPAATATHPQPPPRVASYESVGTDTQQEQFKNYQQNSSLNKNAEPSPAVPVHGRINKKPPEVPRNSQPIRKSNGDDDLEKGSVESNNDEDEDDDNPNNVGKKTSKAKRRIKIGPSPGASVCCCTLQNGVLTIGYMNCVIAFISLIIYGFKFAAKKNDVCYQLGVGFSIVFVVVCLFLIFGGLNRSEPLCWVYLITSWIVVIGALVVLLAVEQCSDHKGELYALVAITCGMIFKIYEGIVIYYFMKEPTPPLSEIRRYNDITTVPVHTNYYYSDPLYVPVGGYGYGYRPYGAYGYGGYGYDPGLAMVGGLGLGMALGGGFGGYGHCGYYDDCYW